MKRNIIPKALRWSLIYSIISLAMLCQGELLAQEISKTFTKELKVAPYSKIISKGPRNMAYASDGRMSSSTKDNKYVLIPGGNDDVPALIIKDYQVFTWEENKIRQIVQIGIVPDEDTPDEAQKLMDKLKIRLTHHADGSIPIDDNLNIAKFGFVNGFFKRNTNTVTLENGEKFRVKSLTIASQIYIPEESNLNLNIELVGAKIGDIKGKLYLNCQGGSIQGGHIKEMKASFIYAKVNFKRIDSAWMNTQFAKISAEKVDYLEIGTEDLIEELDLDPRRERASRSALWGTNSLSTTSTYRLNSLGTLDIVETVNDKFFLGSVEALKSQNSTFSNYEIDKLGKDLNLRSKNGDLTIKSVSQGFNSLKLENSISTIVIGLEKTEDYRIELFRNNYTEYEFPEELSSLRESYQKPYLKGDKTKAGKITLGCESCKITITN